MNSCITEVGRHWADKLSVIIINNPWYMLLVFSPGGPLRSAVVICYSWPTNLFFTEVCIISSRSRDKVNPDTTSICQCTVLLLWGKHRQLSDKDFSGDNWPSLPIFFFFDTNLSLDKQIASTCKSSFYYLYNIRKIRKFLSSNSCATLVNAFITCPIDYCNSLIYYGLPAYQIAKLQRLQNAAARLVSLTPRFSHITPVLADLHWLPVRFRIRFKIFFF